VDLHGDADSWWAQADGRYARVSAPVVGSILVFQAEGRLPYGHVSVVSRVDVARSIAVIQANWVPGELDQDQPVIDVSRDNDWTLVRVWYPPVGAMGAHAYPAYGFIVPDLPAGHDALARAAPGAAQRAAAGG
jgi:surface antigen